MHYTRIAQVALGIFIMVLVVAPIVYGQSSGLNDTIRLTTGEEVSGKIIEQNENFVMMSSGVVLHSFFYDQIESINGMSAQASLQQRYAALYGHANTALEEDPYLYDESGNKKLGPLEAYIQLLINPSPEIAAYVDEHYKFFSFIVEAIATLIIFSLVFVYVRLSNLKFFIPVFLFGGLAICLGLRNALFFCLGLKAELSFLMLLVYFAQAGVCLPCGFGIIHFCEWGRKGMIWFLGIVIVIYLILSIGISFLQGSPFQLPGGLPLVIVLFCLYNFGLSNAYFEEGNND